MGKSLRKPLSPSIFTGGEGYRVMVELGETEFNQKGEMKA
jgi:hypothetical protein